jgi:hypothetical protein
MAIVLLTIIKVVSLKCLSSPLQSLASNSEFSG